MQNKYGNAIKIERTLDSNTPKYITVKELNHYIKLAKKYGIDFDITSVQRSDGEYKTQQVF